MNSKERNSNFELLRIVAMVAIVLTHVSAQAFDRSVLSITNNIFMYFVGSGSRIAVNLFLMTGIWFMVEASFSAKRIIKLYGSLWFYSVFITLILLLLGFDISIKNIGSSFFPFLRRRMWFVSQYIALLLISPILQGFVSKMRRAALKTTILIGFILISCICSIRSVEDNWLDAFVWFAYVFFVIAYFKKYGFSKKIKIEWYLVTGVLLYSILTTGYVVCLYNESSIFKLGSSIFRQYLGDYKSVPNFVISLLIFVYFAKLDIGKKRIVNELAKNTLDVYMIHQQDAFIPIIWFSVFHTLEWQTSSYFIVYYLGTVLAVFIVGSIIGRIRVRFFEPIWINSRLFHFISKKLDSFYSPLISELDYRSSDTNS